MRDLPLGVSAKDLEERIELVSGQEKVKTKQQAAVTIAEALSEIRTNDVPNTIPKVYHYSRRMDAAVRAASTARHSPLSGLRWTATSCFALPVCTDASAETAASVESSSHVGAMREAEPLLQGAAIVPITVRNKISFIRGGRRGGGLIATAVRLCEARPVLQHNQRT